MNMGGTVEYPSSELHPVRVNLTGFFKFFSRKEERIMNNELPKIYDPKANESKIYETWEQKGYFNADVDPNKKPFTIVMPPPNVTGRLHMGHAMDNALQDTITRMKRMQGYNALWLPGTDHAGIATQIKVEEALRKNEGKTRHDLGREAFLERVWDWKNQYSGEILNQLRQMGVSCDWRRLRFTMDEGCSAAVKEVFVNLYNKGMIYRGSRIINWCPSCTTALSDAEVEYEEQAGNLWHIRYAIEGSDESLVIATTRPETMMGDTGIAVHPEDERYQHLIGKHAILPLMNRPIPIFADDYVEKDFGTGCVKVTPCHDPNDFDMAQRHDLEHILVFDNHAKVNENGGKYCGLDRFEARKAVLKDLEEQGLLVKIDAHNHNVGTCYRCGTTVEPMTSAQWFVKMHDLAQPAMEVVKNGEVSFVPERFSKTYLNWMENVHDWCISRQLWWGHRIPAYYCDDCGHMEVSKTDISACPKCGSKNIRQDEDVLDTWFSSALWPFSTLGWPEKTPDFEYFYPTSVLVTGYDIIFFWVARMIFSGLEHTGKKPFDKVFIHGLVRDSQGRKMSKSLGNGIDPLEMIDLYGADALRFTLLTGISPGNDSRFYVEKTEANRNFANKIWNASRFVQMNLTTESHTLPEKLTMMDKWILSKLNTLAKEVNENGDRYELGIAAEKLYSFIWDNYCDWYIELSKSRLNSENQEDKENAQRVLVYVLSRTMELLHPFMPFISETIWQAMPHEGESIMIAPYPQYNPQLNFPQEEAQAEMIMDAIRSIRNRRADMNVPPSKKAKVIIVTQNQKVYNDNAQFFIKLASASEVEVRDSVPENTNGMAVANAENAQIFMPMNELVDKEKELARLEKEKKNALDNITRIEGKLNNPGFTAKAPQAVIDSEKEKLSGYQESLKNIEKSIQSLE